MDDFISQLNISDGAILATDDNTAIWNDKGANLIISGGQISAENGYALYTPSAYGAYSTEITGGSFINNSDVYATVYDYGYHFTISGGSIINNGTYYGLEVNKVPESESEIITGENVVISSKNF